VEKVVWYLLTVRAEHLFLMTLLYTYIEDHHGLQIEFKEFSRYSTTLQKRLAVFPWNSLECH
jgi:hypothetical protein